MAGPTLILTAVTPANTISLNLSNYLQLQPGTQMDPYNPAFTNKVFSHSLLKEGGTLALESLALKELQFPLRLKAASSTGLAELIQQLNQVINSPGATASWQDEGMANPTYFDLASGQFDLQYTFREAAQHFQAGLLRLFSQPLGRTAGPRAFAAASGMGPLLMISPYASSGSLAIAASEQAGVKGYGGQQQGASSGIFYWGNPSLAGDAGTLLQISYVGPLPNTATNAGCVPNVVMSLLPDQNYRVLYPANELIGTNLRKVTEGSVEAPGMTGAVASEAWKLEGFKGLLSLKPSGGSPVPAMWAGQHRLFAIAEASMSSSYLETQPDSVVPFAATATINPGQNWQLLDLGTFSLRASETPQAIRVLWKTASGTPYVTALAMVPDAQSWILPGPGIRPTQYGYPEAIIRQLTEAGNASAPYTNTILIDDALGDQFIYIGASQTAAPSPMGLSASSSRISQFTRALPPKPEPRSGLPIIAILGVAQNFTPTVTAGLTTFSGASWANPQNLRTMAQVAVLERARYIL